MSDVPEVPAELARLRSSIDNIDAALVHLLAERFKCTQQVGRLKAEQRLPPPTRAGGAPDRAAAGAGRRGRSRPGLRRGVPRLHHRRGHPPPRAHRQRRRVVVAAAVPLRALTPPQVVIESRVLPLVERRVVGRRLGVGGEAPASRVIAPGCRQGLRVGPGIAVPQRLRLTPGALEVDPLHRRRRARMPAARPCTSCRASSAGSVETIAVPRTRSSSRARARGR